MAEEKDIVTNEAEDAATEEKTVEEAPRPRTTIVSTSDGNTDDNDNSDSDSDNDSGNSDDEGENRSSRGPRRDSDQRGRSGPKKGGGKFDRGNKRFFYTKKMCKFCTRQFKESDIDYKNIDLVRKYTMPSGKIVPRRINGNCAKHQRMLTAEIKKARILALLPFVDR